MPKAQDITPTTDEHALRKAATTRDRIRIRGAVTSTGDGYSGRYRNTWLRVSVATATVHLTAGTGTPLGRVKEGEVVDLALTMTGLADLADDVFYGQRAHLIALRGAED
jgi:hypothetical protein